VAQCRNGPTLHLAATITLHLRRISRRHQQCIVMAENIHLITFTNNSICLKATVQEARVRQALCRIISRLYRQFSKSK